MYTIKRNMLSTIHVSYTCVVYFQNMIIEKVNDLGSRLVLLHHAYVAMQVEGIGDQRNQHQGPADFRGTAAAAATGPDGGGRATRGRSGKATTALVTHNVRSTAAK